MKVGEAVAILNDLIEGIDPETKEIFPKDHVCHDFRVNRALRNAVWLMQQTYGEPSLHRIDEPLAERPWMEEEDRRLREMYHDGESLHFISRAFDKRYEVIIGRLYELGEFDWWVADPAVVNCEIQQPSVSKDTIETLQTDKDSGQPDNRSKRWKPCDDAIIRKMFLDGASTKTIAKAVGRSDLSILYRLFGLGRKSYCEAVVHTGTYRSHTWKRSDIQQLLGLQKQGCTLEEIANRMGRTVKSVKRKLSRLRRSGAVPESLHEPMELPW